MELLLCLLLLLTACSAVTNEQLNCLEVDAGDGANWYDLEEFVGDGSSGRVYRAQIKEDAPLGKADAAFAAVKIIPLKSNKMEAIASELQVLRAVGQHPNVIQYLSSHFHDGKLMREQEKVRPDDKDTDGRQVYLWIATKWIDGLNLGQFIDDHATGARVGDVDASPPFDAEQTRNLAKSMFRGLGHLHKHGIFHGDIDVSNVMVEENGEAVIVDVGNADFDSDMYGQDVQRLVYALVETCMMPVEYADEFDDGPVNIKLYGEKRKHSVPAFLAKVAKGEYEVPDDLRELVRYSVRHPSAKVEEILQHAYFRDDEK